MVACLRFTLLKIVLLKLETCQKDKPIGQVPFIKEQENATSVICFTISRVIIYIKRHIVHVVEISLSLLIQVTTAR